jgi:hypothetical protein
MNIKKIESSLISMSDEHSGAIVWRDTSSINEETCHGKEILSEYSIFDI